jgi:hypothetical protein
MTIISHESQPQLVVYNPQQATTLTKIHGSPNFTKLFNLVYIREVSGNSRLHEADIICLSDYHCDPSQKYIRAQMINTIFQQSVYHDNVLFLIEGTQFGHDATHGSIETLIGSQLINNFFHVAGWDHNDLLMKGIKHVQDLQHLYSDCKRATTVINMLKQKIKQTRGNVKIPVEKMFDLCDRMEQLILDENNSINKKEKEMTKLLKKIK